MRSGEWFALLSGRCPSVSPAPIGVRMLSRQLPLAPVSGTVKRAKTDDDPPDVFFEIDYKTAGAKKVRDALPDTFKAAVQIRSSERVHVNFSYYKSGAHRDTWTSDSHPWILKACVLRRGSTVEANQCLTEWQAYLVAWLQPFLPEVFGYFVLTLPATTQQVACLLMRRVAFNWNEFCLRVMTLPLTAVALGLFTVALSQVVQTFQTWSLAGLPMRDTHGANICFTDDSCAAVKLVDWHDEHKRSKCTPWKTMDKALKLFLQYVEGPRLWCPKEYRTWLRELPAEVQARVPLWDAVLRKGTDVVQTWWGERKDCDASDAEFNDLRIRLLTALDAPMEMDSAATAGQQAEDVVRLQSMPIISVDLGDSPTEASPSAPPPRAQMDSAATAGQQAADVVRPQSMPIRSVDFGDSPTKASPSAPPTRAQNIFHISLRTASPLTPLPAQGAAAWQALSRAANEQVQLMIASRCGSRHMQASANSICFQARQLTNCYPVHTPSLSQSYGDAFRLLLRLLLEMLDVRGFLGRIEGQAPKTAMDSNKLHRAWVKRFSDANPRFPDMSADELRDSLLRWFLQLFSTDPHSRVMDPGVGRRRRCGLGWPAFWLSDTEANELAVALAIRFLQEWPLIGLSCFSRTR